MGAVLYWGLKKGDPNLENPTRVGYMNRAAIVRSPKEQILEGHDGLTSFIKLQLHFRLAQAEPKPKALNPRP